MDAELEQCAHESPGEYGAKRATMPQETRAGEGEAEGTALARAGVGSKARRAFCKSGVRGGLSRQVKAGIREIARGHPQSLAASLAGISRSTLAHALATPAARAYLAKHRERVDAHRVLLAATLPYLELARMIQEGRKGRASVEAYGEGEGSARGDGGEG